MKQHYPKLGKSILIIFVMIAVTILSGILFEILFGDKKDILKSFFLLSFNTIFIFFIAYLFVKNHYSSVFQGMFSRKLNLNFIYSIIPIIIGTMMLNAVINSLIPTEKDGVYMEFMMQLASNKLYLTLYLIPIVLIAPVTEELVYRGMILRGLSGKYSSKTIILITASFFSLVHLNLAQIPNAFILGLIFAVLMIHSKNILYVIIYHMLNNFLVTFMLFFIKPEDLQKDVSTNEAIPPIILVVFLIIGFSFIYWGLKWTIKTITKENRKILPSDEVYNDYLSSFNEVDEVYHDL